MEYKNIRDEVDRREGGERYINAELLLEKNMHNYPLLLDKKCRRKGLSSIIIHYLACSI